MLLNTKPAPQLHKDFSGPLKNIESHFLSRCKLINEWFSTQWRLTPPPLYGSIDLRNSGFKVAPVDMNLFPAGFNNLNPEFLEISVQAAKKIIHQYHPQTKKILIVAESHTRNLFYWESVSALQKILQKAAFEVRISVLNEVKEVREIDLASGEKIVIEPLKRQDDCLSVDGFSPDFILLNNDLSEGMPDILKALKQPLLPPAELGWNQRLKSEHFHFYEKVTEEFAAMMEIDPWLIAPLFRHCGEIDFLQQGGLDCLMVNGKILFDQIKKKYDEYHIEQQPFLVVKADAGTYGMAVMTVRSIDELQNLNRKQRTKMSAIKGGQPVRRVIIQEGIYTFETFGKDEAVAEPVVYLWGETVVGGFYRVHKGRGIDENLNAPGMQFEPLAFPQGCDEPSSELASDAYPKHYYVYGIISQLSMLAAAREIKG